MLRSVAITAVLALGDGLFHNLHWTDSFEFSIDCFVCKRTDRTIMLTRGAEQGICSGSSGAGPHPAATRISAFDDTAERERSVLHAVVDYWWAPFHDAKHNRPSSALTQRPWIRLYVGYLCPHASESGRLCLQSNVVRPQTLTCEQCEQPLAYSREVPRIQLMT